MDAAKTGTPEKQPVAGVFFRVSRSTCIWLVLLFVALNLASDLFKPLMYIKHERVHAFQLAQYSLTYKFRQLTARTNPPDVLILGSSLPMSPLYYLDCDRFAPDMNRWIDTAGKQGLSAFQSYTGAAYLSHLLRQRTGRPVGVFNMTIAACMASDARMVLSKALKQGKCPKVVVYGIGPRDFTDNLMPPLGTTPTYKALGDWTNLIALGHAALTPDTARDLIVNSLMHYNRVRDDYRVLLAESASQFFNHPRDLRDSPAWKPAGQPSGENKAEPRPTRRTEVPPASASGGSPQAAEPPAGAVAQQGKAEQLDDYSHRYNPPNFRRFAQEIRQFDLLTRLCKRDHIDLIVVNMPITTANKSLVPPALYRRYQTETKQLTDKAGFTFVDLQNDRDFSDIDFLDTVHLNAAGGKRLEERLAEAVFSSLSSRKTMPPAPPASTKRTLGSLLFPS